MLFVSEQRTDDDDDDESVDLMDSLSVSLFFFVVFSLQFCKFSCHSSSLSGMSLSNCSG